MSTLKATNIKNESSASNNIVLDSGGGVVVSGILTATTFSGNVSGNITIGAGSTSAPSLAPSGDSNTGIFFPAADTIAFAEGGAEAARFDSNGRFGLGTVTPEHKLHVTGGSLCVDGFASSASNYITLRSGYAPDASGGSGFKAVNNTSGNDDGLGLFGHDGISLYTAQTERGRITQDGKLLVGTTSASAANAKLQINSTSEPFGTTGTLAIYGSQTNQASGNIITQIIFGADTASGSSGCKIAHVKGSDNQSDSLTFHTGSTSLTERMRITSDGTVLIQMTAASSASDGCYFNSSTDANFHQVLCHSSSTSSLANLYLNRQSTDGTLIDFRQADTTEGSISVSGTTVSYNGGHLSRWSQLPNDEDPSQILKGTVMSNLNEMCEWGEEDNEQLNKTKVSDVEGDKNVAGLFVSSAQSEDGPLDFYLAMTGDMIIRIGAGVTVERGDLLMSAGDGTAKPQDDDIVRSKTVAKVTSTSVTCTYDDGSYCVPCVLMAC